MGLQLCRSPRQGSDLSRKAPDSSPEHFTWLVKGRSANQKSTLDLYRIIHINERKLNKNAELHEASQELTGVAFSLWRAVFLSDTSGEFEDQLADVKTFLVSLISDNSVLYATDKNSRNWSFRYYLDNATYRLRKISESRLPLVDFPDLVKPFGSEKDEWFGAQFVFEKAVTRFETALDR